MRYQELDTYWKRIFELEWISLCEGSKAIAALIVSNEGDIISEGRNKIAEATIPNPRVSHAEAEVIRNLDIKKYPHVKAYTLYTSLEPCPMCMGTIVMGGIRSVVIGTKDAHGGAMELVEQSEYLKGKNINVVWMPQEYGDVQRGFQTLRELLYNTDEERLERMMADFSVYNKKGVLAAKELFAEGIFEDKKPNSYSVEEIFDRLMLIIGNGNVYEQTRHILKQKIKELFATDCSGHDYWHSLRVLNNAEKIAKTEKCDEYIVMIAALLHDTDDRKIFETADYENARRIMSDCHLTENTIADVIDIIREISFKGTETTSPKSIEGKIVQDADRLDAMGAIGIARAFAYGGNHNRAIHIPACQPNLNMNETEYRNNKGTTINHFYEKLLLIKDMMNTDCAKSIAQKRDGYMREFLKEFYDEWNEPKRV